ncbi:MAG: hypothetical protein ACMG6E_01535, partial [Candidatus Roizmanbacteria bacterium]
MKEQGLEPEAPKATITITISECVESHVGMEKLGTLAVEGYSIDDLRHLQREMQELNIKTELHQLNELLPSGIEADDDAAILILRKAGEIILEQVEMSFEDLHNKLAGLDWDKQAFMKGKVVNKKARYNLCFSDKDQEPDYDAKKGRVVALDHVPGLLVLRDLIAGTIDENYEELKAEGNLYFDGAKCGIGWHSDLERKKVIAIRFGSDMSLCYHWFQNFKPIGTKFEVMLAHGDVYVMSAKAVGNDGRKQKIPILRHAAGCKKYTDIPDK